METRIVFDVDDTICANVRRLPYDKCTPKKDVISKINYLHDVLHYTVILYTSRGMVSCNGDLQKIVDKNKAVLEEWLSNNGVHYDELIFGKPIADLYVDDKAIDVSCFSHAPFYPLNGGGSNKCIQRMGNLVKKDLGTSEETERFKDWIEDCGDMCLHPAIISYLYNEVYMEYIEGVNLCDDFTRPDLYKIIEIIESFGAIKKSSFDISPQIEILDKNRSNEFTQIIDECKRLLCANKDVFEKYASFGHGDMILSNIIKNEKGLYLIDPRYFRESSTYIFDYGKLRMSLMNYEKRFGISEKDNSGLLEELDAVLISHGVYEIVLITTLMYVCRLYRYKDNTGKEIVVEMAKEVLRQIKGR